MTRQAKGPAVRPNDGRGNYRFRRAAALCLGLALLVSLGAVSALADAPPSVTIGSGATAEYTTAAVSGTVNPAGGPSTTFWHFEYTTTPADESSWQFGPGGEIAGPAAEGTSPIPVQATLESLQPATQYSVRLVAENQDGANRVVTSSPYPTFTTKGPVGKATVTFAPVTTFSDTTAHFSGTIDPNALSSDPGFNVHYEFHCTPSCNGPGDVPPQGDIAADNSTHPIDLTVANLQPNTQYKVELFATNAGGTESAGPREFHTTAVGPVVETVPAFAIQGGTEALLGAKINAKNAATTYRIEYGPTDAYGNSAPAAADASAGSGGSFQVLSQRIGGLTPSTVYHFRAVAENDFGEDAGDDMTFETAPAGAAAEPACGNAGLRAENNSTALPECRAYERVSPADKNGFDAGAGGAGQQSNYAASPDGSIVAFESFGSFADAKSAALLNQYLSQRGPGGWATRGVTPVQYPSAAVGPSPVMQLYSPNLRFGLLVGGLQGHLAPGDNPEMPNYYLFDAVAATYKTLNLGGDPVKSQGFAAGGISADGTRAVFVSTDALTPDAVDGFNGSGGRLNNVYEWHQGQLKLVSVRLNTTTGEEEPSPQGGYFNTGIYPSQHQVSEDGSRIVFKDAEDEQLYLREDGVRTLKVSASEGGSTPETALERTDYLGASADGSKVFFQTVSNLTPDAAGGGAKLYRFDADTETLDNLTADGLEADAGLAWIPGTAAISEDGAYVYFQSTNRFNPGDNKSGEKSLYVWHDGDVRFVSPIAGDFNKGETPEWTYSRYRVSPDGRRLSFVSIAQLTAYDNTDSVPAEDGSPREDSEVYVYDFAADRVTCVSCNPSGERPTGAPAGGPAAEGTFPAPPLRMSYNPQPGVGNDGSIFFNSRDALVPQDVNGKMDVYRWTGGRLHLISTGTGGGDSFLASSSVSGDDVFFETRERLIAADKDDNEDIYDARVGGGFPSGAGANACEGIEGCHGPAGTPPQFDNPASSTFSSAQKGPSPDLQRLRKALKSCKHKKKRKAKARCRAAAKKRYAKASQGRAK